VGPLSLLVLVLLIEVVVSILFLVAIDVKASKMCRISTLYPAHLVEQLMRGRRRKATHEQAVSWTNQDL
jgi:hypothetical protein